MPSIASPCRLGVCRFVIGALFFAIVVELPLVAQDAVFIDATGNVGIGNSNPTTTLDVSGDARIAGDLSMTGDISAEAVTARDLTTSESMSLGGYEIPGDIWSPNVLAVSGGFIGDHGFYGFSLDWNRYRTSASGVHYKSLGIKDKSGNVTADSAAISLDDQGIVISTGTNADAEERIRVRANGEITMKLRDNVGRTCKGYVLIDSNDQIYQQSGVCQSPKSPRPFDGEAANLLSLTPITYRSQGESGPIEDGYLPADVVESGLDRLVLYDEAGEPAGVDYDRMTVYVVEMLKEHHAALVRAEEENRALRSELEALRSRISVIERGKNSAK